MLKRASVYICAYEWRGGGREHLPPNLQLLFTIFICMRGPFDFNGAACASKGCRIWPPLGQILPLDLHTGFL